MSGPNNNLEDSTPVPEKGAVPVEGASPDEATIAEAEENKDQKNLKFSYIEPVAGIAFSVLAAVIFLGFPIVIGVYFIGGHIIPTFIAEYFRDWSLWIIIPGIIWTLLRVGVEVAYLVERRYTKRLAKISVIGNVLAAICTFIMFVSPRIVNQDYVDWVHAYFANVSVWFGNLLANPHLIILFIIIVALILDSVNVVRKGNKAEDKEDDESEPDEEDDPKLA